MPEKILPIWLLFLFGIGCGSPEPGKIKTEDIQTLTENQREALIADIEEREDNYDPSAKLLKTYRPPDANRYHSDLVDTTVYPLRQSTNYAADLLDTGIPKYEERAFEVLETVLKHQDTDTTRDTYGIWPYFAGESLDEMVQPDWNWADFIGSTLIEIYIIHQDVLPGDLKNNIREAITRASRSIKKRDVGPGYTNIAIMGTFVTYVAGYLFDLPEIQDYANMRLERFYDYTMELGGFREYNSPTYTRVALDELLRMKKYIVDLEALGMINECYHIGWEVFATHFHPPTGQLCGPHSRSYSTLVRDRLYAILNGASEGALNYKNIPRPVDYYKMPHKIPDDLLPYFQEITNVRTEIDTFSMEPPYIVGYSHLTPEFCFGTVNQAKTWEQRRPYVAYWGSVEAPRFMRVQLLHDFVDFATGMLYTNQKEGESLSAMALATDGGDYHIHLDHIQDGQFMAEDLRVRFQIGDAGLENNITLTDYGFHLQDGNMDIQVKMMEATFGNRDIAVKVGSDEETCYVDWIIYQGDNRQFDLTQLDKAIFSWYTRITSGDPMENLTTIGSTEVTNGNLNVSVNGLKIKSPVKPVEQDQLEEFQPF